jgi:uncharacterized repeat protein (TIGR03806 family)
VFSELKFFKYFEKDPSVFGAIFPVKSLKSSYLSIKSSFLKMKKIKIISAICFATANLIYFQACNKVALLAPELLPKLSDYAIYKGKSSDLVPNNDYKLYELSAQLFTDYAEKQRLIKVPTGTTMTTLDDGLLNFPEGTIIVKTFYYFNDKRDTSKGKKIIETRLLVKTDGVWKVGDYMWNDAQNDAFLITTGYNKIVNWIDEKGTGNVITYHIPNNIECKTCHNSSNVTLPIGPKTRNLNFAVKRSNLSQNQLTYLHNQGVLNAVNPTSFATMPNYKDTTLNLEKRGRAYMDINCAHCHAEKGYAGFQIYKFGYETSLQDSKIVAGKSDILSNMQRGKMPKIGTTIIDKEGVDLIKPTFRTSIIKKVVFHYGISHQVNNFSSIII